MNSIAHQINLSDFSEPYMAVPLPAYLDLQTKRPPTIQKRVDKAFQDVLQRPTWGLYNGSETYDLCGVREHALMKRIIQQAPLSQTEFYVLDGGAGDFQWGDGLAEFLEKQEDLPQGIKVHIIGTRGEPLVKHPEISPEMARKIQAITGQKVGPLSKTTQMNRCTVHRLGAFKLEELRESLKSLEFDVEKKLDLVVSHWCLRHLADPVRTFFETYHLLRPKTGLFLFDGFLFLTGKGTLNNTDFNLNMIRLLRDMQVPFIRRPFNVCGSLDQFILRRPDEHERRLPMEYQWGVDTLRPVDVASYYVTRFKREPGSEDSDVVCPEREQAYRGDKALYEWLRKNHVLHWKNFRWAGPLYAKDAGPEMPALHASVLEGDLSVVEARLQAGEDVNESDDAGRTPIYIAAGTNHEEIFQRLLKHKADVNLRTPRGETPLHNAATFDHTGRMVSALLSAGAEVYDPVPHVNFFESYGGPDPLSCAIKAKNEAAIDLLLKARRKDREFKLKSAL